MKKAFIFSNRLLYDECLVRCRFIDEKVLKVNGYLNDMIGFSGMNEVYKGRFGGKAPFRTAVAVATGGLTGDLLVEMA